MRARYLARRSSNLSKNFGTCKGSVLGPFLHTAARRLKVLFSDANI
jgi:hypothetical protein